MAYQQQECTSTGSVQRWIWKWQLTFGVLPLLGLITVQTHHKSTFLADPVNVKQCGFTCVAALSHPAHRSLPGNLGCGAKQTKEGWNRHRQNAPTFSFFPPSSFLCCTGNISEHNVLPFFYTFPKKSETNSKPSVGECNTPSFFIHVVAVFSVITSWQNLSPM